jgi:hypothetical protein
MSLMMRPHWILHARVSAVSIMHGNIAIAVAYLRTRHERRRRIGGPGGPCTGDTAEILLVIFVLTSGRCRSSHLFNAILSPCVTTSRINVGLLVLVLPLVIHGDQATAEIAVDCDAAACYRFGSWVSMINALPEMRSVFFCVSTSSKFAGEAIR